MTANHRITRESIQRLLQVQDIESLSLDQIQSFFLEEEAIAKFAPDGVCQVDPRNGDRIVFNSARARRPHDNRPTDFDISPDATQKECVICNGQTTGVIDLADLSKGFTFINKNLFPVFYPAGKLGELSCDDGERSLGVEGRPSFGFHFLQWTSSFHDKDWHNMPQADRVVVMQRLAALEKKLLAGNAGFVSIIKNYGRLVGGSLAHGHQQIGYSNIMPRRLWQDWRFGQEQGETFSSYLWRNNPDELIIRDYGSALLLTPYFMRRPFDMILLLKDDSKSHLYQLDKDEMRAVSDGWRDAINVMLTVLPLIGRELAYNITTHNAPGGGLYFEFLPYTQEMGGFEHLGLYLCQGNPQDAAAYARSILSASGEST